MKILLVVLLLFALFWPLMTERSDDPALDEKRLTETMKAINEGKKIGLKVAIQGNTLLPVISPQEKKEVLAAMASEPEPPTWNEQIETIWQSYPGLADLLVCIVWNESRGERDAVGDWGMAHSYFQIWPSANDISMECICSFECALHWAANEIWSGRGGKWTTYLPCLEEIKGRKKNAIKN